MSDPRPGGKFMMYGGIIDGEYIELQENKKIEMKWRFKDWGEAYSHVIINFEEDDDDVSGDHLVAWELFVLEFS